MVILVIGMFLVPLLTGQIGRLVGQGLGWDMTHPMAATALSALMTTVQGCALVGLTVRHVTTAGGLGLTLRDLGITLDGWPKEVGVGLLWGVALFVVNVVTSQLVRRLFRFVMSAPAFEHQLDLEGARLAALFAEGMPPWLLLLLSFTSVVVAPVAEELFFRGYAHAVFRARFPTHALLASSALFAFVHFYVIHFVPVFVIGWMLAVLYERRGNLLAPVVAHALSNFVVTVAMVVQSFFAAG